MSGVIFLSNSFRVGGSSGAEGDSSESSNAFNGIGYTGGVVNLWGENCIFDLSNVEHNQALPALINHDPNQRAGVIDQISVSNQIAVSGKFLSNAHGESVQQESKDGFPFQMSIGVQPRSYEYLREGQTVVNGQTVNAPATIYRNNVISEISFVPVGADLNTSAFALSGITEIKPQTDKPKMSEQAPDYAAQLSAKDEAIAKLAAELQATKDAQRESEMLQLEQKGGFKLSDTQKAFLKPLNQDQFNSAIELMGVASKTAASGGVLSQTLTPEAAGGKAELSGGDLLVKLAKEYK